MRIKKVKLNIVPTKSSTYFLPILDSLINFKFLELLQNSYLINSEEEGAFCVLYKWSGKQDFTEWEEEIMNHHLFIGHEDYEGYVLYKFKLPKNAQAILELFVKGEYSKYPKLQKENIKDFIMRRGFLNYEKIFKIMNLDEELRIQMEKESFTSIPAGSELSSPPDMDSENFRNSLKIININEEESFN